MNPIVKKKNFIIRVLFIVLWAAILYCTLKYVMPFLMPFLLAFGIAFVTKRPINHLAKRFGVSRKLVSVLLLTVLYLVVLGVVVFLGAKLVVYLGGLFGNLPAYYENNISPALATIGDWFDNLFPQQDAAVFAFLNSASDSLLNAVSNVVASISSWAVGVVTGIVTKVPWYVVGAGLTVIASYFIVMDYYAITSFIMRQFPEDTRKTIFAAKDFVVNVLFKFAKAYAIILSITFVEAAVGLLILQVPYAIPMAALTALVDILPVFGTGTIMIPWAIYSLLTQNYFLGIGLAVVYIVITVVRQVLEPRIVGRQIGLYPLITLIAMFIGARLFGFWGMLGLPVALTVVVHLNRAGAIHLFKE